MPIASSIASSSSTASRTCRASIPCGSAKTSKRYLKSDLAAENEARALYLEAAKYCESVNDRVTKVLFESLAGDEEGHIDFLETQLELIKQVGVQLYAQKHIGGFGDGGTPGDPKA